MIKKFTNLNNDATRLIVAFAGDNEPAIAFTLLINHRTDYEEHVFKRLFKLLFEISPLTYTDYKKLHPQIKTYISNLYDKYISNEINNE